MSVAQNISRAGRFRVALIAAALFGASSSASAEQIFAITSDNVLLRFDSATPELVVSQRPVTGLGSSEFIRAIDVRPESGDLYALTTASQLYTISPETGAASAVGTPLSPALTGTSIGIDFNPVVDLLRVVTGGDENLRVAPTTGAITGTDTALAYDGADTNTGANPAVGCAAYTNNFSGANATTLFGIDTDLDSLVTVGGVAGTPSPNTGTLFTQQRVGVDTTTDCGADVSPNTGKFYAAFTSPLTSFTSLYVIDLGTAKNLTRVGQIGAGSLIRDIAVVQEELNAPGVTITRPAGESVSTRSANITIQGTTADDNVLESVRYRIIRNGRGSSFRNVSGTTSFTFTVSLQRGTQTVQVVSTDIFGNQGTDSVTVTRR